MNFTENDHGLLVPIREIVQGMGRYIGEVFDERGEKVQEFEAKNVLTNEGLIYLLNAGLCGATALTTWYMGVFTNNYTPVITDTASSIIGNAAEFTSYSGGARPTFAAVAATQPTPTVANSVTKASFSFTAGATLMGGFLISSATPGSNTGTLYSAAQFGSSVVVANGYTMTLGYSTTLASS